jgi:LacI family transcriptional regulator
MIDRMKTPTSRDVAALAGVSQPTVSRALRADPAIPVDTRMRIQEAAARLGYVPSRRGRSLATRTTGHVALVVGDIGNPFYIEAIEHLHNAFAQTGHRVVVLTDQPTRPCPPEDLLDGSFDGAVLATTMLGSVLPLALNGRGLPVVLFNRALDADVVDSCVSDNQEGARAVAHELIDLGHRRISAIFGPADTTTGRDREAGFRMGLAQNGVALHEKLVRRGRFTVESGYERMLELLQRETPPTAVFCANDVIALGALNAAASLGVSVPNAVSVIGFDDIAIARWDIVGLTTVRQDLPQMARVVTQLMLERIASADHSPRRVVIPTAFVRRRSHGACRRT